jgi:hypothetical protein
MVLVRMQAEYSSSNQLSRPYLYNPSRAIAVFDWERKRALLVGASHALPFALAYFSIEYETLGASADPAEQCPHDGLARLRPP